MGDYGRSGSKEMRQTRFECRYVAELALPHYKTGVA